MYVEVNLCKKWHTGKVPYVLAHKFNVGTMVQDVRTNNCWDNNLARSHVNFVVTHMRIYMYPRR
jgi:hypothetical protein